MGEGHRCHRRIHHPRIAIRGSVSAVEGMRRIAGQRNRQAQRMTSCDMRDDRPEIEGDRAGLRARGNPLIALRQVQDATIGQDFRDH